MFCHWIRENIENYKDCVVTCPDEYGVRKVIMIADDLDIDYAVINSRRRHRSDIDDKQKRPMKHSRLNHQHLSDNWQIVEEGSSHDDDDASSMANEIEQTLRFAESSSSASENGTSTSIPRSSLLKGGLFAEGGHKN